MLLLLLPLVTALSLAAQNTPPPSSSKPDTQQSPNKQETPPEAGGPQNDVGPYVIPKKKEEPPPPPPEKPKKIEGMPDYSLKVDVPLVNVDVSVISKDGQFIPGLKQDNFRVLEDGVPQKISTFNQAEAPITAVLLVEYAATNYNYMYDALNASYTFKERGLGRSRQLRHAIAHPGGLYSGQESRVWRT
jgi:hypothetical protein